MTIPSSGIFAEIRDLREYFKAAHALLRDGKLVDLTGVDIRIAKLCQDVQSANPDIQQRSLPELMELIDLLNDYGTGMQELKAALDREQLSANQQNGDDG